MPLTREFVAAVRDAGDIVRLVSDYVPLKPAGARMKGLCPFHQEKTPSFSVDPTNQLFYCFGCQTGGDLFKFVMLYEKTDFPGAVELLAGRFGVPVPTAEGPDERHRRRLLEMNEAAEAFFVASLADPQVGRVARGYLDQRGIVPAVRERLRVGHAPDGWEALAQHLTGLRFLPREILSGGLAVQRKTGSGHYDRFRNRLMFPIRDVGGRVVAFGGRILGEGEPKYLNSPETPAYVKGDHLYGLDLAKDAIRREGFAIVVEGYLDLAAVLQAGFENVVASLGTAFTPAHARLLSRFATRIVVSYDGDAAGASAAIRSLDVLLERGLEVRVAELPPGLDPDDLIRQEGADAYDRRVRQAPGYLDFLVGREAASRDLGRVDEKVAAINALLPRLGRLSSAIERVAWVGKLADAFRVDDDLVLQELRNALKHSRATIRHRADPEANSPEMSDLDARFVKILLEDAGARERAAADLVPADLDASPVAPLVQAILRMAASGEPVRGAALAEALERDEDRDLLARIVNRDEPGSSPGEIEACLASLRARRLRREGKDLQRQIESESTRPIDDLLARKMKLAREIDTLSCSGTSRGTSEER